VHPNNLSPVSQNIVVATHAGVVEWADITDSGAYVVRIRDTCGGNFQSRYVHLLKDSITVVVGQPVSTGTILGIVGCTGFCASPHVHYDFREPNGAFKTRGVTLPPYMTTPYLPKDVPYKCVAGSSNPCNVTIP
jgi:murein DD-endopeptidase MepM/ murein hydrolase activator NlpD